MKTMIFAILLTVCLVGCAATVEVKTPEECPMCKVVHEEGVCVECEKGVVE